MTSERSKIGRMVVHALFRPRRGRTWCIAIENQVINAKPHLKLKNLALDTAQPLELFP